MAGDTPAEEPYAVCALRRAATCAFGLVGVLPPVCDSMVGDLLAGLDASFTQERPSESIAPLDDTSGAKETQTIGAIESRA